MIQYRRGGRWHFLNIFLMKGSVFPASFLMAGPCALASFLIVHYDLFPDQVLLNSTAWTGFSSLVGFLVVFRTSEAYSRFWSGCTATHHMRAEWADAAVSLMAMCKFSTAEESSILNFKHLAIRLFSLLHAMALGEIEDGAEAGGVMAHDLELIDPCGLDKESWKCLARCQNKTTLVFSWLMSLIVDNIKTGVLSIPPPILSRVFQELANGMVQLHEARKISNVPFPFPYAQTCDALLFLHWMITPVVTAQSTSTAWAAACFGFVQVFILWSLNNIAVEIEHPFGDDANDLDANEMQLEMNMSLLLVLHPASTKAPTLSEEAQTNSLWEKSRASCRIGGPKGAWGGKSSYNDILYLTRVHDRQGAPFVSEGGSTELEARISGVSGTSGGNEAPRLSSSWGSSTNGVVLGKLAPPQCAPPPAPAGGDAGDALPSVDLAGPLAQR